MAFQLLRLAVIAAAFVTLACWVIAILPISPLLCTLYGVAAVAGLALGACFRSSRPPRFVGVIAGSTSGLLLATILVLLLSWFATSSWGRLFDAASLWLWYGVWYVLWPLIAASFACTLVRAMLRPGR